jgi:beta-phosphoglucomutase-like phosphatase (HAD superfamily)
VSLRGLLFDLDGTLVDSDPIHYLGWRDGYRRLG